LSSAGRYERIQYEDCLSVLQSSKYIAFGGNLIGAGCVMLDREGVPGRSAKIFHFFCDRPLKGEGSRKVLKIVSTEDIL
jgi:hypothetical protein